VVELILPEICLQSVNCMENWRQFVLDLWVRGIVMYCEQAQPEHCEDAQVELVFGADVTAMLFKCLKKLTMFFIIAL